MMKVWITVFILTLLMISTSCGFTSVGISHAAQKVQIIENEGISSGCKFLGHVSGSARAREFADAQINAQVVLRNNAAELGADTAVLDMSGSGTDYLRRTLVSLDGRIFKCHN